MGLIPASDFARPCARLWTRYLCVSLECDVRWLDRTLLMPVTDHSGVLPNRLAPHAFREIHASGKNPDGNYWTEYDDSGARFNLFERVCQRVPSSRPWLFKEFLPYIRQDPPPIAHSRSELLRYLEDRELTFLPKRAVSALLFLRPLAYRYLRTRAVRHLLEASTPSTLLFLLTYLHEVVWWAKGRSTDDVERIAVAAVLRFSKSLLERGFDDVDEIARIIESRIYRAVFSIKHWGDRSPHAAYERVLEDLPPAPLLIRDTAEMREACACVHAAGEDWFERAGTPLPSRYEALSGSTWAPTPGSIQTAISVIISGVLKTHAGIRDEFQRELLSGRPTLGGGIDRPGARPQPNLHQPNPALERRITNSRKRLTSK